MPLSRPQGRSTESIQMDDQINIRRQQSSFRCASSLPGNSVCLALLPVVSSSTESIQMGVQPSCFRTVVPPHFQRMLRLIGLLRLKAGHRRLLLPLSWLSRGCEECVDLAAQPFSRFGLALHGAQHRVWNFRRPIHGACSHINKRTVSYFLFPLLLPFTPSTPFTPRLLSQHRHILLMQIIKRK